MSNERPVCFAANEPMSPSSIFTAAPTRRNASWRSTAYACRGALEFGVERENSRRRPFFTRTAPGPMCQPAESSSALAFAVSKGSCGRVLSATETDGGKGPARRGPAVSKTLRSIAARSTAMVSARRTARSPKIGCGAVGCFGSVRLNAR